MARLTATPHLSDVVVERRLPFHQTLRLREGSAEIARALWFAPDSPHAVVQIAELWVRPEHRRRGHGSRLLRAVLDRAAMVYAPARLRRVWIGVGHKSEVVGRSFLTRHGFHHISAASGLLRGEDMLVYVKSYT